MRKCPTCKTELFAPYTSCPLCSWEAAAKKPSEAPRPVQHRMTPEAKAAYESGAPRSGDLTEQQWYNVCRFWPSVARRCSRPFADVGPHNPLHASSNLGPLMRRIRPPEVVEREPGQEG